MTDEEEKQDVIVATSQVDGSQKPSRIRLLQTWGKPLGTAAWQATLAAMKNKAEIEDVAKANPANIQQVAASQLAIVNSYYESVLMQAQQSFAWALRAAGVGLLFFIAAVSFLLFKQTENVSVISLISGALIEIISAINFYLYSRASSQLPSFHTYLDTTQRFILANSVCENLSGEIKQATRAELVRAIADYTKSGSDENVP